MFESDFYILAITYFMAVAVPGQDFILNIRNSLLGSRACGIATSFAIACGAIVHISYTIFGFGYFLKESPIAMMIIKALGGAFLIYLAIKAFIGSKKNINLDLPENKDLKETGKLTPLSCFNTGITSALLNPFTAMFFISVFSSLIDLNSHILYKLTVILEVFLIAFIWMSFVTLVFSNKKVKDKFNKMGHWIGRISGTALFSIALKILFMT